MNETNLYRQLHHLYSEAKHYGSGAKLQTLFRYIASFPQYAVFNLMLAHVQRPGARFFATETDWWKRFRRCVKPEANPMVILRSFGPVDFVYDVSDTYGEPLPPEIENPFDYRDASINEAELNGKLDVLLDNLPKVGVRLRWVSYGSQQGGCLRLLYPPSYTSPEGAEHSYWLHHQMEIDSSFGTVPRLATLAHELGHLFCGHLGKFDVTPERRDLSLCSREFEAESVCWLYCKRCGFNYEPAVMYLHGYLEGGKEIPPLDIGAIIYAVHRLETMSRPGFHYMKFLEMPHREENDQLSLFN